MAKEYEPVYAQAWMNERGCGIHYHAHGERFPTRAKAIREGLEHRGSDDFNIAVVEGDKLVSFDWMDKPVGESPEVMTEIASELELAY